MSWRLGLWRCERGTLISSLRGCEASSARGRMTVVSGSSGVNPMPCGRGTGSSLDCGIGGRSLVVLSLLLMAMPDERDDGSDGPFVRPGILSLQVSEPEMVVFALEDVVEGARESVAGLS